MCVCVCGVASCTNFLLRRVNLELVVSYKCRACMWENHQGKTKLSEHRGPLGNHFNRILLHVHLLIFAIRTHFKQYIIVARTHIAI